MPTFNSLIARGNVNVNEDVLAEIFGVAAEQSAVFTLGRQLRGMTTQELRLDVLSALPSVYFVGTKGDSPSGTFSHLKQTTAAEWSNVTLTAEELAVIVPIPNNVLADANFPVFDEIKPLLTNAIAQKVDSAVLFGTPGTDVPATWRNGVFTGMPAAHKIAVGGLGDIYNVILGGSGTYAQVEADGYMVNGNLAAPVIKGKIRGLRDGTGGTVGMPVFNTQPNNGMFRYELDGAPTAFDTLGSLDQSKALMITGDWTKLVWSIRQDIKFDVSDSASIHDASGALIHNAWQEDSTLLRVTFRMGWELPNPINYVNSNANTRYPFAAVTP